MKSKMLSVIIPAYNSSKTIEKAVNSIKNQNLSLYEIIVINDGSTDNTSEVLKKLKTTTENFIFVDIENSGPSNARNIGIEKASGEYCLFLDSDDYIEDDCLGRYMNDIIDNDIDMFVFGCKDVFIKNNNVAHVVTPTIIPAEYKSLNDFLYDFGKNLNQKILYSASNKIYKMSIIDEVGIRFKSDLSIGEDILFNLDYFENMKTVKIISECPYVYTHILGSNSLSSKYISNEKEVALSVFDKIILLTKNNINFDGENRQLISNFFIRRTSPWINTIFLKSSNMTFKQKHNFINSVINEPIIRESLKWAKPLSKKDKLLQFAYRNKMGFLVYLLFKLNSIKG